MVNQAQKIDCRAFVSEKIFLSFVRKNFFSRIMNKEERKRDKSKIIGKERSENGFGSGEQLRRRRLAHFQEIWYTFPTEGGTIFFRANSSLSCSRYRIVSDE